MKIHPIADYLGTHPFFADLNTAAVATGRHEQGSAARRDGAPWITDPAGG